MSKIKESQEKNAEDINTENDMSEISHLKKENTKTNVKQKKKI